MQIGFVLYPDVTALDAVGPYEVLSRIPGVHAVFVGQARGPVTAQHGLTLGVQLTFGEAPALDVLCVPGGPGQTQCMENQELLAFLRRQAETARWMTAVCTGSLILGAAGLLQGYRATSHWRYVECLAELGAIPVSKRIVADQNRVTAAGVSAGIDLGLFLAGLLAGERVAQTIQLQMEYDPQPPFRCGSPELADPDLVESLITGSQRLFGERCEQVRRIGAALRAESAGSLGTAP